MKGKEEQYDAVREADLEENDLDWLPPAPMNNTYAFADHPGQQREVRHHQALRDQEGPARPSARSASSRSSPTAPTGLPGMLETYGLGGNEVPGGNRQIYQTGAIYDATAKGECIFGEVFTTDGRIVALDLQVLEDDKAYFPNYNVSLVVRDEVAEQYPEIEEIMAPVTEKLTDEVMLAPQRRDRRRRPRARGRRPAMAQGGGLRRVTRPTALPGAVTEPWRIRGSWVGTRRNRARSVLVVGKRRPATDGGRAESDDSRRTCTADLGGYRHYRSSCHFHRPWSALARARTRRGGRGGQGTPERSDGVPDSVSRPSS